MDQTDRILVVVSFEYSKDFRSAQNSVYGDGLHPSHLDSESKIDLADGNHIGWVFDADIENEEERCRGVCRVDHLLLQSPLECANIGRRCAHGYLISFRCHIHHLVSNLVKVVPALVPVLCSADVVV